MREKHSVLAYSILNQLRRFHIGTTDDMYFEMLLGIKELIDIELSKTACEIEEKRKENADGKES